jgi:peptidoglycan glycosyltransferase
MVVAMPIVVVLFAMMVVAGGHELTFTTLAVPIGLCAVFLATHFALRKLAPAADPAILPITFALCGIGIAFVTSLTSDDVALKQLIWMLVGIIAMIVTLALCKNLDKLANYKYTFMAIGIILLLSPMLPGIGTEINGSRLWLTLGPLSFQPGELAKICIVIFLAAYLSQNREMLSVFTWRVGPLRLPSLPTLLPLLAMWALAFLIVVLEKDLGSALVLFLVFIVMLYVATGKKFYVIFGLVLAAIGAVALYGMFSHVQTRVQIWLNPFDDAQGSGYQIIQALYSMADGGLFGEGIGRGMNYLIPYVESDFIFAAIAEEIGLLGASGVLLLYLCFAIRGILTAARAKSDVSSMISVGATAIVILQSFIIVGGVTRLIPLTGITLPFISQGGSSLLAGFIIVGLLLRAGDEATGLNTDVTSAMTKVDAAMLAGHGAHGAGFADNSVLGRVSLGKRLTHALVVFSILFAVLVANLTYIMVIDASRVQNLSTNNHTMARLEQNERGTISTSDGVVLAQSVETEDGTYERVYPAGDLASHVVGYYSSQYGTSGIEAACNETLTGSSDFASWTDVLNSLAGVSTAGNDVKLSINSSVQQAAQNAIAGYTGACVVLDPTTGAILAMASSPTYDAADFADILSGSGSSQGSELLNRAIDAIYAPGSTFKMVTLTGALEDGAATVDSTYNAPGVMEIGNANVHNFNDTSYGTLTLRKAFELSSNTVFGQVGVQLGAKDLVAAAEAFGFNKALDFTLPVATSLMPDPDEMTEWETAWAAAGEPVGEHSSPAGPQATVLQMALVGAGIANNGTVMQPYIVEGIYNASGVQSFSATANKLYQATTAAVADEVLDVMKGVVTSGTGTDAAVSGVSVAGKTGTAENTGREDDSWFVGIADADGAKNVVVAIMIENAGSNVKASAQASSVIEAALQAQGVL